MSRFGDRRLQARAALQLALSNVRYWASIAPLARRELARWEHRAQMIPDPELRALALSKLDTEGFNAEAAGMLAALAPRGERAHVVRAVVALELLFDLLDGLSERPLPDPLADGERLFAPFVGVFAPPHQLPPSPAGGRDYPQELSVAAADALACLPSAATIMPVAARVAERAAQAQIRMHAVPRSGAGQLREWAQPLAYASGLQWRELLAGSASSVLALHALIAAAADPATTPESASRLQDAYLSICVLLTLLDAITDRDEDALTPRPGFLDLYRDPVLLDHALIGTARRALTQTAALPDAAHHLMVLNGVVAYYASAPGAASPFARPIIAELRRVLRPLISPTLAVMRAWRLARPPHHA